MACSDSDSNSTNELDVVAPDHILSAFLEQVGAIGSATSWTARVTETMRIKSHTSEHDSSAHEEIVLSPHNGAAYLAEELDDPKRRERTVARLRLLFGQRSFLFRLSVYGFIASTVIAFLIPSRYTSETRLMPPDNHSASGLAI